MRTVSFLSLLLLLVAAAAAQDRLISPYQPQAQSGLRGLSENEIAELRAGTGMGLARAAELNSYPGPRHVLDAVATGRLQASPLQVQQVRLIFDGMKGDAQRIGADILKEEQRLEAAFRAGTITDPDLRLRVTRIAALQGELRAIHLRAHLATRAMLSAAQLARYNELRGYTTGSVDHPGPPHTH
jgi:hypothetical protein